ncbi:hypothetical protein PG994_003937 [Apiospora phragmitis]|uniref:Uncharacterized protein n=1 Tax=Apiospora phragmitis TaxID=2905665 RepID=A0ABR1VZI6_9PEZI
MITLAYPGTACIKDWTTACTYDITMEDAGGSSQTTSRQEWCCAPGYSCTTRSAEDPSSTTFERQCYSYLNSQTEIWASWDPPATGSADGSEYYTYPTSITWQPPRASTRSTTSRCRWRSALGRARRERERERRGRRRRLLQGLRGLLLLLLDRRSLLWLGLRSRRIGLVFGGKVVSGGRERGLWEQGSQGY